MTAARRTSEFALATDIHIADNRAILFHFEVGLGSIVIGPLRRWLGEA